MTSQEVIARFSLFQSQKLRVTPHKKDTRASAVMLPLIDKHRRAHVLLCKRPSHLIHHPGEICLPGGKFEAADITLRQTAVRELHEELNIAPSNINIYGELAPYNTLTGFSITPFICQLNHQTVWQNDANEVAASFLLPIEQLANEKKWQSFTFQRFGKTITLKGFRTEYGLLWGATASIIKNFTDQLALPV